MFTEKEIAFFQSKEWLEALEKLGGWEPEVGDSFLCPNPKYIATVCAFFTGDIVQEYPKRFNNEDRGFDTAYTKGAWIVGSGEFLQPFAPTMCTWLPTLDQLLEMLRERGQHVAFDGPWVDEGREWWVIATDDNNVEINGFAPSPRIAVGKALVEVVEKEERNV